MEEAAAGQGQKTHTTALAWVPAEAEVWAAVQPIREKHDRVYYRWPPHVNM